MYCIIPFGLKICISYALKLYFYVHGHIDLEKLLSVLFFMELDEEVGDIRGAIFLLYTCLHYMNATKQA